MLRELQKVAAATIAAMGSFACMAGDPDALYAIAAGSSRGDAISPASQLRYSGASAVERWNLVASAVRKPWDCTDPLQSPRFDARDVLDGESTRASLAFDWQRSVDAGRVEAAAFARHTTVDLHSGIARLDGSSYGERFEQRDRRSVLGAALRWSGDNVVASLPAFQSAALRLRTETYDADGAFRMPGGDATGTLREDRMRQTGTSLDLRNEIQLAARLRSSAGVRYDAYRFAVSSDLAAHDGSVSGVLASPHASLVADLAAGSEAFVTVRRGYAPDDPRAPGAAIDPRSGAPVGRLDPLATLTSAEAGLRARFARLEAGVTFFRARSGAELLLGGDSDIAEIARPAIRRGVQLSARYEPASWVTLDLQAAAFRARYADGAGERVAGATERTVSAATSVRILRGWTASLLVNSLGARGSITEGPRVKASTFVNARLARSLSKRARVSLDVFNVFDRRLTNVDYFSASHLWNGAGSADSFLFNPAEARGFRVKLRTTF